MIELTPAQARAIATIRAVPARNPIETYAGWLRFFGADAVAPTEYQHRLLDDIPAADQLGARMLRLRAAPRLMEIVKRFAEDRDGALLNAHIGIGPASVLGAAPEDRAGQMVLLYALSKCRSIGYANLAKAFSIPFQEFGERIMMGELIIRDDDQQLQSMAMRAIRSCDVC